MAPKKKVTGFIKLQIQAGAATPAPPVGPALGQHGVNIMEFVKAYNDATASQKGQIIPVEITVYEARLPSSLVPFMFPLFLGFLIKSFVLDRMKALLVFHVRRLKLEP